MNYYNKYNIPIEFNGDIIITDPCYIMRKDKNALCKTAIPQVECPEFKDYFIYGKDETKYPDLIEQKITLFNNKEDIHKAFSYFSKNLISVKDFMNFISGKINTITIPIKCSPMYTASLTAYNDAYKRYEKVPHNDWNWCKYGSNMNVLGFTKSAVTDTLYGDWGCTTLEVLDKVSSVHPKTTARKPLGHFCADAGLVGVFLVDEVMNYNPDAVKELREKEWCATFIDNFKGTINFMTVNEDDDKELHLVGNGNINFITIQTDL